MLKRTTFFAKRVFPGAYAAFHHDYHEHEAKPDESENSNSFPLQSKRPQHFKADDFECSMNEEKTNVQSPESAALSQQFLRQVNLHDFQQATILLAKIKSKLQKNTFREMNPTIEKPLVRIRFFSENFMLKKQHAMQQALYKLNNLLADPLQCSELLKNLDTELANYQQYLDYDFAQLSPGPGILLSQHYIVPSESILSIKKIDTHDLLLYLIRKQLAKEGIDTQNEIYTFFDFINEEIANNLVRQGILFRESPLSGNAILHGIYAHYLQWYLFSMAIEKGIIKLSPLVSLYEIMTLMIDSKTAYNTSGWSALIDYAQETHDGEEKPYFQFHLGSPYRINLYLLSSPLTPHLRGYLLNEWARDITLFQSFFYENYKKEISYECLVESFASANEKFDGLHLQITKEMIAKFYREQQKCKNINSTTGILLENAEEKFAWARERDSSLHQKRLPNVS